MRKNYYRLTAYAISFVMMILLFSGCSKQKTSDYNKGNAGSYGDTGGLELPITNKGETISILMGTSYTNKDDVIAIKELEKRTGVKIKPVIVAVASYAEKLKMLIASGEMPDITRILPLNELNNYGMQGAFVPINKYIDQLPNFKRIFVDDAENSSIFKSSVAADGNLYYWPEYEIFRGVNHGFLYRKDIFDKHGIPEWKNTEEFYQALKKLKGIYPDSLPYVSKVKTAIFKDWAPGWGITNDTVYYDYNQKLWKLARTQPQYKEMLDFMKKLYDEKLLDPEFLTDTQASWSGKMTQEAKSFVTFDWISRMDIFYEQIKGQFPNYNLRYGNPVGPTGKRMAAARYEAKGFGPMVANNQRSLVALKLLDYLTSPSGAELITMGIEGVTYKFDAEGKIEHLGFPEDKTISITDLEEKYGLFTPGLYTTMDKRSLYFRYTPKEQEAQDKIIGGNMTLKNNPVLNFTEEEQKIISQYQASLEKQSEEFSMRYVMASKGGNEWQEWLEKADALGASKIVEIYNNAQKRFDSQ